MKLTPSFKRPEITNAGEFASAFARRAGYTGVPAMTYITAVAKTAPLGESPLHGFRHWLTVLDNGLQIIEATPAFRSYNLKFVMILFALFHDIRREGEGECQEHGKAGAMFLRSLPMLELLDNLGAAPEVIRLAAFACECHTICSVPDDSIILRAGAPSPVGGVLSETEVALVGACLDADRLDLGRVGIHPHPYYLSTQAAKNYAAAEPVY